MIDETVRFVVVDRDLFVGIEMDRTSRSYRHVREMHDANGVMRRHRISSRLLTRLHRFAKSEKRSFVGNLIQRFLLLLNAIQLAYLGARHTHNMRTHMPTSLQDTHTCARTCLPAT